jgi:bacteriorhodopsin
VILIHASLGLLFFAYMLTGPVGNYLDLSARRLQVSSEDRDQIVKEQMTQASRISLIFSSAFFFMLSVWLMTHLTETNLGLVQRSTMIKRLDFCLTLCLYITFFSSLFNAVQLMDDDNLLVKTIDGDDTVLDVGRIVEWMLTCPLIQLAVPILGGEKVPDSRRYIMPTTAFLVLLLGFLSTMADTIVIKALLYSAASLCFALLLFFMNACVSEASSGGESLFYGSSFLRGLTVVIALTWLPFPVWYALSPEGFNIIKDEPGMKVAVAFLNLFSKGSFIMYLTRIRADYQTRQKTMVSVGYLHSDGTVANANKAKAGFDFDGGNGDGKADDEVMNTSTLHLIEEVLETMGRGKDKAFVVDLLQSHLVTTNEDVLSLTKEYCREINLPWGLVLALKSKIRSHSIQLDDPWSMQEHQHKPTSPNAELSYAAPHIAKSAKKIESVRRRQSTELRDDMSEKASNYGGYPSSAMSNTLSTASSAPLSPKLNLTANPYDQTPAGGDAERARMAAVLENHQKNVNAQVDECRQFVMHSMDKIMNVLEQRLTDGHQPAAGHPSNMNVAQPSA